MKRYHLEHIGQLLMTRAAVHGPKGTNVIRLLLDTGSSYTILPVEVLKAIGCDPIAGREDYARLVTGNGIVLPPRVSVEWLHVLGHQIEEWKIIAHTIPFSEFFDGLLGMDVLTRLQAQLDVRKGTVYVAE